MVSNDHYLIAADERNFVELAFDADLTRSIARGRPWMLMEHSPRGELAGPQRRQEARRDGPQLALARGARGGRGDVLPVARLPQGAEKFHSAMLPHAGTDSRVWREVTELGRCLDGLADLRGSRVEADVAILWTGVALGAGPP